jgi:hypothetical protein
MKDSKWLVLLATWLLAHCDAVGQTIELRASVKVILHPTTGARPTGITDDRIRESFTNANVWLTRFSRGYRYRLMEIVEIGGPDQGGMSGPSQFFGLDSDAFPDTFQQIVNADSRFQLRTTQVNLLAWRSFVSQGGGACPTIRNDGLDATRITCRIAFGSDPWTLCHELGHFFGLYHTFGGCECNGCTDPSSDGDGIADTLREASCFTRDQIALENYFNFYTSLTASQQLLVNNTFSNVMSYHAESRENGVLTPLQLDRVADIANGVRSPFASGRTIFVSTDGSVVNSGLLSTSPKPTIASVTNLATANDIVLLRHGTYPGAITLRRPITLRTPAEGAATIGN